MIKNEIKIVHFKELIYKKKIKISLLPMQLLENWIFNLPLAPLIPSDFVFSPPPPLPTPNRLTRIGRQTYNSIRKHFE